MTYLHKSLLPVASSQELPAGTQRHVLESVSAEPLPRCIHVKVVISNRPGTYTVGGVASGTPQEVMYGGGTVYHLHY